ncbi:MAG: hypothetical protein Q9192_005079 [Flavoplaca navasiana]
MSVSYRMNSRVTVVNGIIKIHGFYCRSNCLASYRPSNRLTLGIVTRRCLTNTPFCPEQKTLNKDAAPISTSSSLLKVHDLPAPHTGHIRVITLNSPRNKNAISQQLLAELETELKSIHDEDGKELFAWQNKKPEAALGQGVRAIVIGSEVDGVFCAGADLKERKTMTRQEYGPSGSV